MRRSTLSADIPSLMVQPVSMVSAPTLKPPRRNIRRDGSGMQLRGILHQQIGIDTRDRSEDARHHAQRPVIMARSAFGTTNAITT